MEAPQGNHTKFDASRALSDPTLKALVDRLLETKFSPLSRDTGLKSISKVLPRCAIVIQTAWRRWRQRKKYLQLLKSVLKAQCLFRSKLAQRRTKILRALNEVYQTEKKYTKMLTWLIENYEIPMRSSNIISADDADTLFAPVRPLLLAHQQVVIDLEIARLDLGAFFRVVVRLVDLLPAYTEYIGNYSKALDTYSRLCTDQKFTSYCILRQERSKVKSNDDQAALDLRSLLITPIQRPPRYVMLLQQILKYLPSWSTDRTKLLQLTKAFEVFTDTLNAKASTTLQPVQMLQSQAKDLFSDERKLVRAGEVGFYDTSISGRVRSLILSASGSKQGRGSVVMTKEGATDTDAAFPMHTLFLFSDMLVVMREQPQAPPPTVSSSSRGSSDGGAIPPAKVRLETCAKLLLKDIKRVDTPEADSTVFVVALAGGRGKLSFSCMNMDERRKWVRAFESVMPLTGAPSSSRTLRNSVSRGDDAELWSDVFVLKRDKRSVIASWMESKKVRRLTVHRGMLNLCKNKTRVWVSCGIMQCEVVRVHKRPECLMLNIGAACHQQTEKHPITSSAVASRSLLLQFRDGNDSTRWYTRIQQAQVETLLSSVPANNVENFSVQVSGGSRICRPALVPRDSPPSSSFTASSSAIDHSAFDNSSSSSTSSGGASRNSSASSCHSRSASTSSNASQSVLQPSRIHRRLRSFSEPKAASPPTAEEIARAEAETAAAKLKAISKMRRFKMDSPRGASPASCAPGAPTSNA